MALQNFQLLTWDGTKQKRIDSQTAEIKFGKVQIGVFTDIEAALTQEIADRVAGDASTLASANSYADSAIASASASLSGDISDLQSDLAAETSARQAADAGLAADIASEASARAAADSAEAAARAAADTALQGEVDAVEAALAQELLDRAAGDAAEAAARAAAISAEASARIAGDASTLSSANTYTDGKISDLVNSAPAVLDTLKELADALGSDPNFATTVANQIGSVAADLATETSARQAADTALQGEIDAEEAARIAADGVLDGKITTEKNRAEAAEAALQANIDAEEARALAAEAVLQGQLDVLKLVTKSVSVSVTVGQVCYVKADGTVAPAIATAALHDAQLLIASQSVASGSGLFYVVEGSVVGGFSGLTPGKNQYVSASSAGAVVESLSGFAATNSVYSVGRAVSTTQISFSPKFEFEY